MQPKPTLIYSLLLLSILLFSIASCDTLHLYVDQQGSINFPSSLVGDNYQKLKSAFYAEKFFNTDSCIPVDLRNVNEIMVHRDSEDGDTRVEIAQVAEGEFVKFDVCRKNSSATFTITIDNRQYVFPIPSDQAVDCQKACTIQLTDFGVFPAVIKTKPGAIITWQYSFSNVSLGAVGIFAVSGAGSCAIVDSILNFNGISSEQEYRFIVPRSLAGSSLSYSVFPFCGLSELWNGRITVGRVSSQVYTLFYPQYYLGDELINILK